MCVNFAHKLWRYQALSAGLDKVVMVNTRLGGRQTIKKVKVIKKCREPVHKTQDLNKFYLD